MMKLKKIQTISKGIAGAVTGAVVGNIAGTVAAAPAGSAIAMTAAQAASMPWWGVVISNAVYAGIGFAMVYFSPANKPA